ncbi:hypothetical protein J3Q64DRAFT_1760914, partial [Phycomyces blakesleeanus]
MEEASFFALFFIFVFYTRYSSFDYDWTFSSNLFIPTSSTILTTFFFPYNRTTHSLTHSLIYTYIHTKKKHSKN